MDTPPRTFTLTRPDDWHLHLRDGDALAHTVPWSAAAFARAIVMPNLKPPVTTTAQAADYRARILAARPAGSGFEPLMTLYLTEATSPEEIDRACDSGLVQGVKLYPAGATTHSDSGVTSLARVGAVFEAMQRRGLPLLVHGEVTDPEVDVFDREAVFIERHLAPLRRDFPELRVVLEHVTTRQAVQYVGEQPLRDGRVQLGATITAHHLLYNRNAMFTGGMRPHYYCLPVLKRETHRQALLDAATGGDPRFFLGTDSAPHARPTKETACACAGCLTAPHALELYAEAFEQRDALHRLEGFAAWFGADFYGLPRNRDTVTLLRVPAAVPERLDYPDGGIVPLDAGRTLAWRLQAG